jgi:NTE family protein
LTHNISLYFLPLLLFFLASCGYSHRLNPREDPPPLPSFYVPEKIRVALVLGSGGVRGMAHVGVLEELEAAGIPIDIIIGCSAGSIVGALYADNPDACAIKEAVSKIKTASVLDFDVWQCRYGLCQGRSLLRVIDKYIGAECFDELKIPLVVVASDLNSGELVPMGTGRVENAVVASCSIPFMFVPCEHMGRILVDGGVVNPVPVKLAKDLGADIVIAVDLCELLTRTFPTNLFEVAERSAEIAFMWQNESCSHCADVIIRPKTCDVGTFADDKKELLYQAGRKAARDVMCVIQQKIAEIPKEDWECNGWRLFNPHCYTPDIYLKH